MDTNQTLLSPPASPQFKHVSVRRIQSAASRRRGWLPAKYECSRTTELAIDPDDPGSLRYLRYPCCNLLPPLGFHSSSLVSSRLVPRVYLSVKFSFNGNSVGARSFISVRSLGNAGGLWRIFSCVTGGAVAVVIQRRGAPGRQAVAENEQCRDKHEKGR